MNSNQFISLLKKGNDLQKEDFQQLVKLHGSFPYFQIPAVLAAKYELQNRKQESSDLLHLAAILSPNRARLKVLLEQQITFFDTDTDRDIYVKTLDTATSEEADSISKEVGSEEIEKEKSQSEKSEEITQTPQKEEEELQHPIVTDTNQAVSDKEEDQTTEKPEEVKDGNPLSEKEPIATTDLKEKKDRSEESDDNSSVPTAHQPEEHKKEEDKSDMANPSLLAREEESRPQLITTPYGGDEATRPDLILPGSEEDTAKQDINNDKDSEEIAKPASKEEEKPIFEPIPGPPSNRQQILKQLEDNLARLKSESIKNQPEEKPTEVRKPTITRRKRSGDDLIDSIKKKEKREIKDTKKKEQNDIIKAFNTKSIKLAAIKENEDVNKLQDLSLPSTKINDRMVSESYAKLLTQQGKKAAAKEIYKKLILKFPQKKAYFADLIQQLEE